MTTTIPTRTCSTDAPRATIRWCALLAAALLVSAGGATARADDTYADINPIPPRIQWNSNFGYCGEVSFISAGLYYGQYVSQYDARALAGPGVDQNLARSQLLVGVNDQAAAAAMHLNAVEWDTADETSTSEFLAWVKQNAAAGFPVVIGIFDNQYRFYGKKNPNAGDASYDHIVPVFGVASDHPLPSGVYYASDTLSFNDNGEWAPHGVPTYVFTYRMGPFQKTRQEANAPGGAVYSVRRGHLDYGIAITGVMDTGHDTVPVRLATSVNYEKPAIANGSTVRPPPMPLTLTATVSSLTPGIVYKLYRYDSFSMTPNDHFNANAGAAAETWTLDLSAGSTYSISEAIMSDDEAIYRAVPASAP